MNLEIFRRHISNVIWSSEDMGGFIVGVTEKEAVDNVSQLLDIVDPEWRNFTNGKK